MRRPWSLPLPSGVQMITSLNSQVLPVWNDSILRLTKHEMGRICHSCQGSYFLCERHTQISIPKHGLSQALCVIFSSLFWCVIPLGRQKKKVNSLQNRKVTQFVIYSSFLYSVQTCININISFLVMIVYIFCDLLFVFIAFIYFYLQLVSGLFLASSI